MEDKKQEGYTNEKALELFTLLNNLKMEDGTKRSDAQARTLRSMKSWYADYQDQVEAINTEHAATYKNEKDVEIILRKTLKKTKGDQTEDVLVNEYSKEGETKRQKALKELMKKPISVAFKVFNTEDASGLTPYEKVALEDLHFLIIK